jgi:outer membrane protein assembly factor BamD (BamD/ComL family)
MRRFTTLFIACGVMTMVAGCGRESAREKFEVANRTEMDAIHMMDSLAAPAQIQEKFAAAVKSYQEILASHPADSLAEAALFRVAYIRSNYTHEIVDAISAYKEYARLYPNGRHTEVAMFVVGFLYNNSLQQYDSAAVAYKSFLARFPQSEYAASAEHELSTLGKSPEELLPPPEPLGKPKHQETPKTPV